MSTRPPPARGKAPPPAQQGRGQPRQAAQPAPARAPAPVHAPAEPDQQSGMAQEEATVTAGQAGERNLQIEWIDVPLGPNWTSAQFQVRSLPGHRLEGQAEQLSYTKKYTGEGQLLTEAIPMAAHGTRGKLVVRDLDTGEVLEQPWIWHTWGGGGLLAWLFGLIRKLFAKPAG